MKAEKVLKRPKHVLSDDRLDRKHQEPRLLPGLFFVILYIRSVRHAGNESRVSRDSFYPVTISAIPRTITAHSPVSTCARHAGHCCWKNMRIPAAVMSEKRPFFARPRFTVFAGNGSGLEVEKRAESVGIAGGESDDVEHCR